MSFKTLFFPLAILVSLMVSIVLIKPVWDEIKLAKEELIKIEEELGRLDGGIVALKGAVGLYKGISQEEKQLVAGAFPEKENNDDLVAELNKISQDSGVFLNKIAIENDVKKKAPVTVDDLSTQPLEEAKAESFSVGLEVMGDYLNLRKFVNQLEKQNRIIIFSEINFSSAQSEQTGGEAETGSGGDIIFGELALDAYYKPNHPKLKLAERSETDPIIKTLFAGKIDKKAIDDYKYFNNQVFWPVKAEGYGKENIFAR